MECCCNGLVWFVSYISLQDTLIYLNLTKLIHQPELIRKPALRRACKCDSDILVFTTSIDYIR